MIAAARAATASSASRCACMVRRPGVPTRPASRSSASAAGAPSPGSESRGGRSAASRRMAFDASRASSDSGRGSRAGAEARPAAVASAPARRRAGVRCARGSSTRPPPSVPGGAMERTTMRSPSRAISGRSHRSCQRPGSPLDDARGGLARPVVDLRAARRAGAAQVQRDVEDPRRPQVRASSPTTTSPRPIASTRTPARLTATRCPASARSRAVSCTCYAAHAHTGARPGKEEAKRGCWCLPSPTTASP